jgi:hypothetical protein
LPPGPLWSPLVSWTRLADPSRRCRSLLVMSRRYAERAGSGKIFSRPSRHCQPHRFGPRRRFAGMDVGPACHDIPAGPTLHMTPCPTILQPTRHSTPGRGTVNMTCLARCTNKRR